MVSPLSSRAWVERVWTTPIEKLGTESTGCSLPSSATATPPPSPPLTPEDDNAADAAPHMPPKEPEGLTDVERRAAWALAGFDVASSGHARPIALWIIGPSAVGKSTLAFDVAADFGIPACALSAQGDGAGGASGSTARAPDGVLVDGESFREAWGAYQEWAKSPDWVRAYPSLKQAINRAKTQMLREAARQRKHLIMPHTCMDLGDCISTIGELTDAGYMNHVLAVAAPRNEVADRGKSREEKVHKRYAPGEFEHSIAAFGPMIAAANGRYEVVFLRLPEADCEGSPSGSCRGAGAAGEENGRPSSTGEPRVRQLLRELLVSGACGSEPDLPTEMFG